MKHNIKITLLILAMFVLTQFIGLYVINYYAPVKIVQGQQVNITTAPQLPYGLQTPQLNQPNDFNQAFISIIFAFVIAISILLLLTKLKAQTFLKIWFLIVIVIALGISLNSFIPEFANKIIIISAATITLAIIKVYRRNFLVHNLTELIIYPGIAAVFVPIFNIYTMIALLILISIYDMWAVWHSGIMQKMAKYQINKLNLFSGFFVPYISDKLRLKLKKMKKINLKNKKVRVNVAILGGGDIVFPIITAGVVLKTLGFIPSLLVILGATLGLGYLLLFAEKKKFYPAMPFITAGIFIGLVLSYLFF